MPVAILKCDYTKNVWVLDNPTPGQRERNSTANWNIALQNGTLLTDPANHQLLAELQAFVRSALEEPDEGLRLSPGSVYEKLQTITELANFMIDKGLRSVAEISSDISWDFVEFIEDYYEDGGSEVGRQRELTHASAYRLLLVLSQIHTQRRAMKEAGVAAMPEAPFCGRSVYDVVVQDLGLQPSGKLVPIPDRIAIATLGRAYTFVVVGASDVIRLQSKVLDCYERLPYQQANSAARELISRFEFSVDPRTGQPWHNPIELSGREMLDGRKVDLSLIQGFRRLILDLVGACTVCIQGGTGIRAHELIGLESGRLKDAELPRCVRVGRSSDGLLDMFFIKGITAKRTVAATEWILGTRPVGVRVVPPPVAAINVLQDLLEPWRELGGLGSLLVTFCASRGLPRSKDSIGSYTAATLTNLQKEFAIAACMEAGNMTIEEAKREGRSIRAHRWRPTFAQFVFRTSPRLLIPLRDHFKHIGEAVTDQGYVGNDAKLLEDLESERVQETARILLEISLGKSVGAGSVQHLIDRFDESLAQMIQEMNGSTNLQKAMALVEQHSIRIWNGTYAACFMNLLPHKSKCNDIGDIPVSVRSMPDYGARSPGVCASCRCCWIRSEHRSTWEERLSANEALVAEELAIGNGGAEWSIAGKRVKQSRAILQALDRALINEEF